MRLGRPRSSARLRRTCSVWEPTRRTLRVTLMVLRGYQPPPPPPPPPPPEDPPPLDPPENELPPEELHPEPDDDGGGVTENFVAAMLCEKVLIEYRLWVPRAQSGVPSVS